ncbi:hypothetical protein CC2G_001793 [Coprinopsis cinerea AmutBmut pab1-1]|nr:hypothetical protein CC2G_001793 [Coprinopsis cinerea AmutBmut pab1-1]
MSRLSLWVLSEHPRLRLVSRVIPMAEFLVRPLTLGIPRTPGVGIPSPVSHSGYSKSTRCGESMSRLSLWVLSEHPRLRLVSRVIPMAEFLVRPLTLGIPRTPGVGIPSPVSHSGYSKSTRCGESMSRLSLWVLSEHPRLRLVSRVIPMAGFLVPPLTLGIPRTPGVGIPSPVSHSGYSKSIRCWHS